MKKIAVEKEINLFYADNNTVCISLNEATTEEDFTALLNVFEKYAGKSAESNSNLSDRLPQAQLRQSDFMTHPVFSSYRSESALMRYIKNLSEKIWP